MKELNTMQIQQLLDNESTMCLMIVKDYNGVGFDDDASDHCLKMSMDIPLIRTCSKRIYWTAEQVGDRTQDGDTFASDSRNLVDDRIDWIHPDFGTPVPNVRSGFIKVDDIFPINHMLCKSSYKVNTSLLLRLFSILSGISVLRLSVLNAKSIIYRTETEYTKTLACYLSNLFHPAFES